MTHDTLAAYCGHPNVGAVLVIALGCEQVVAQTLADAARRHGKPVEIVAIQSEGGTVRTTEKGSAIAPRARASRSRAGSAQWCDVVRADPVAEVRRVRLHLGPRVEPGARPRHRSARRSRRQRGARRDRRDHGRRAPARGARQRSPAAARAADPRSSRASKPRRARSASTSAARSRRPATSAAA